MAEHTEVLEIYLQFLAASTRAALDVYFEKQQQLLPPLLPKFPENVSSSLHRVILENHMNREEILILLAALAVHLKTDFFDQIIQPYIQQEGEFARLGGVRGSNSRSFLPTGETLAVLLNTDHTEKRLRLLELLGNGHFFKKKHILWLEEVPEGEPELSGRLVLDEEYKSLFLMDRVPVPQLSINFPAQHLETELEWHHLVLNSITRKQISELEIWLQYNQQLLTDWEMKAILKPGYRALFHGPPGTGKTLTATLLGKYTGKPVFRVDLSLIVSKFIGETEKNLSRLFAKAENKDWILFFDEADSLFGKRTNVRDAHDKYANQEASYLLQRIEQFNGLVILATNFKNNIDDAFMRRFQSVIHFPFPNAEERLQLWTRSFPSKAVLNGNVSLDAIARKYDLSGSGIINVVQYSCLQALNKQTDHISPEDILNGIRMEYAKENRVW